MISGVFAPALPAGGLPPFSPWPPESAAVTVDDGGGGGGTNEIGLPVVAATTLILFEKGIVSRILFCVVSGNVALEPKGTVTTNVLVLITLVVLCREAGHSLRPVDTQTKPVNVTASVRVVVVMLLPALAASVGVGVVMAAMELVLVTDSAHWSAKVV